MSELTHLSREVDAKNGTEEIAADDAGGEHFKDAVSTAIDILSVAGFVSIGLVDDPDDEGRNHLRRSSPLPAPVREGVPQVIIAELERRRAQRNGSRVVAVAFGMGATLEAAEEAKIRMTPHGYVSAMPEERAAFQEMIEKARAALEFTNDDITMINLA